VNPSDIFLDTHVPLTAVFGRVEAECAAAIIIITLAETDDTWRPMSFSETTIEMFRKYSWAANPFVKPSIDELVSRGFATLSEDRKTAELTESALEALRKSPWNRSRKSVEP